MAKQAAKRASRRSGRTGGARLGTPTTIATIADLVGSVDSLPADLSARKKAYLKATSYGRKRGS
jgi:hypothetical protein